MCVERADWKGHIRVIKRRHRAAHNITPLRANILEKTMKKIIATALVSLSLVAPAAAADKSVQQFFALTNDSPAENFVGATSVGDPVGTAQELALVNDSPAENTVNFDRARNVDVKKLQRIFALTNDSPAENIVR